MTVLAFDTATSSCAITLWHEGDILAHAQHMAERGHAEVLVPMIESVLATAGLAYGDLDLLAVTIGPGAFTGIRIGLATARGLALASSLPLIGVTNFDALVHGVPTIERQGRLIVIVLETKRADFYLCCYDEELSVIVEAQAVDEAGLLKRVNEKPLGENQTGKQILLTGDCVDRALKVLQKENLDILVSTAKPHVDPAIVAELAAEKFKTSGPSGSPAPLYLKPPDVNVSGVSGINSPTRGLNFSR